jgi:hypothetical protein
MHGGATALAFAVFIDNGQVEYGSRYWITGWSMMAPLAAGGVKEWLGRRSTKHLWTAVLILTLYALSPVSLLFQEGRSRVPWPVIWAREQYPPNSIIFVRSTAQNNPSELIRNLPESTQNWVLFLEPGRNRALRRLWSHRPAYILDFKDGRYLLTPFEEATIDDSLSKMLAANHLAFFLDRRQRGVDLWRSIPPHDPAYSGARLNAAIALFKLGKSEQAKQELELARQAGVPEATIQGFLMQNRLLDVE